MTFCIVCYWDLVHLKRSLTCLNFPINENHNLLLPCCIYQRVCAFLKGMDDVQVRGAATDIFSYLVEYNPSMVREFVMQESQQNDDVSQTYPLTHVIILSTCLH